MTVRLLARHSLLVGLVAGLASVGGFGCADDNTKSSLDPEGPPEVLQVFVNDPGSTDDPLSEYAITYGIHPNAWKCGVIDDNCPGTLTCATSGDLKGHCVDGSGNQPGSTSAIASVFDPNPALVAAPSIRIISKELLDGETLEMFACACFATECTTGEEWTIDPEDCSACGEDSETAVPESGRCLDVNNDRVPDLATLQEGVATITCDNTAYGTNGTYTTGRGDGYYYPEGNQVPTSGFGYAGVGPAIVIEPLVDLPTGSTCNIKLTAKATDKDGESFTGFDSGATFVTTTLDPQGTTPTGNSVPISTKEITVHFNAVLDPASVGGVQIRPMGGAPLTATAEVVEADDPSAILITLGAGVTLANATTYEIVLPSSITDQYGSHISAASMATFKTVAATKPH